MQQPNPNQNVGAMSAVSLKAMFSALLEEKMENLATKEDIEVIKTQMQNVTIQVEELKMENQHLKDTINIMQIERKNDNIRLEMIENQFRKKNLIFKGIEAKNTSLSEAVKNICKNNLKVNRSYIVKSVKKLTSYKGKLAVIAEMESADVVEDLLKRSKLLKGTTLYLEKDLSKAKQQHKKVMIELKKDLVAVDKAHRVSVINEKLKVEDKWFFWDANNNLKCGALNGGAVLEKYYKNVTLDLDYNRILAKVNKK